MRGRSDNVPAFFHPGPATIMTDLQPNPAFDLPTGVSFRKVGDSVIFLDVNRDRYAALTRAQTGWFEEICAATKPAQLREPACAFARRLLGEGLIRAAEGPAQPITECRLQPASASAFDDFYHSGPRLPLPRAPAFLMALIDSRRIDSTRRLRGVFETVTRLKARLAPAASPALSDAVHLAACAHSLAPLFLTTHDACRFRSLLLIRFLAMHGVAADWVFGVRIAPFRAHCWVEYDHVILNDFLDQTAEFQKILSV